MPSKSGFRPKKKPGQSHAGVFRRHFEPGGHPSCGDEALSNRERILGTNP